MKDTLSLLNCPVKHITLGVGKVISQAENSIMVEFSSKTISMQFPQAFDKFLVCENEDIQKEILLLNEQLKETQKKEHEAYVAQKLSEIPRQQEERIRKQKAMRKENIAFKCNYCNGGQKINSIGYHGVCSDDVINYNIEVAKHNWCCDEEAPCKQYHDGLISRAELDNSVLGEENFVCYESQMLKNWRAFAGFTLTGEKKQTPMKLSKVQVNSLAILTTREPYSTEKERFIFGVFLVDEAYEGDNQDEGYVTTTSKYKISLTKEEAKTLLFWNYYHNENAPHKTAWGQGLHRYISNNQAASILADIAKIKKGSSDAALAQEFFEYFCKINSLNPNNFPILDGSLIKID